jgi:peptidoglycan L-alanyl-D-glutamate endopeptidase CwlK
LEVAAVIKKFGWEWGGDWKRFPDFPHFQKTFGKTPSQLFALYNAKKVDAQGYVIL